MVAACSVGCRRTTEGLELHSAAMAGDRQTVEALLAAGQSVDAPDEQNRSPLYLAAKFGHVEVVTLLLDRGADVNRSGPNGFTALHVAAQDKRLEVMKLLLARGANVNALNDLAQTPLWQASWQTWHGDSAAAALLLDHGADLRLADNVGYTPLNQAISAGNLPVIKLLLSSGADLEARTDDGFTLLHSGAFEGQREAAEFLIERGADVNARTKHWHTPVYLAAQQGHLGLVRMLIERGADIQLRANGWSPLDIAVRQDHTDIVALLRQHGARLAGQDQPWYDVPPVPWPRPPNELRRIQDDAGVITPGDLPTHEGNLYLMAYESGIDVRFVLTRDTGGLSLEDFAAAKVRELGVGGQNSERRGLLVVFDVASQQMRVEVGYGLEEYFPDAFVDWLIRDHARALFAAGDINRGLAFMCLILESRIRREALGMHFDPRAVDDIRRVGELSGGAGATGPVAVGQDRSQLVRGRLGEARRRHYSAQPTVELAHQRYQEWLAEGVFDPEVELFTPESRAHLASFPLSPAYYAWAQMNGGPDDHVIHERDGLALLIFTRDPLADPCLFRRTPAGWQRDIVGEVRCTRGSMGNVYTWGWVAKYQDEYSRAFGDLMVMIRGTVRFAEGDNRMLPIRGPQAAR
jgi:ankyrin repeat protein